MTIGEKPFVMLLVERFFKSFIPGKEVSDTEKSAEVLVVLSADSREAVDDMITKGGRREPRTSAGWHAQGRFYSEFRWQAPEVASQRSLLWGVGRLPRQRVSR
jgi:uncharacterized protein